MSLRKNTAHFALVLVLLAVAALGSYFGGGFSHGASTPQKMAQPEKAQADVKELAFAIPPQRRKHILYGDESGGGHKAGYAAPGKSEFPKEWDDDKIIDSTSVIANDTNIPMRQSGRYWLKTKEVDGIKVRVVLDREKGEVVTSYPLNGTRKTR